MDQKIFQLAQELGTFLAKKNWKIATAESCTGGAIAQAITDVPGSSNWFDRGFVTYSNQSKIQMLQVKQETLDGYGAVSKEVVIEMSEGALINSDADLAVAVTGIAGPDGGTEAKPMGTVFIAVKQININENYLKQIFLGNRMQIRQQTVQNALELCMMYVLSLRC